MSSRKFQKFRMDSMGIIVTIAILLFVIGGIFAIFIPFGLLFSFLYNEIVLICGLPFGNISVFQGTALIASISIFYTNILPWLKRKYYEYKK